MMLQPITRLGPKRDRSALPDGVSATDFAIAQLVGMANSANIWLDVVKGRLVVVSANGDWATMRAIGRCLNEFGIEAIVDYFVRNPAERRARLSEMA